MKGKKTKESNKERNENEYEQIGKVVSWLLQMENLTIHDIRNAAKLIKKGDKHARC